jgi:hypothetical protein
LMCPFTFSESENTTWVYFSKFRLLLMILMIRIFIHKGSIKQCWWAETPPRPTFFGLLFWDRISLYDPGRLQPLSTEITEFCHFAHLFKIL